jgi:thiol:disulfide interchange protein DsbA
MKSKVLTPVLWFLLGSLVFAISPSNAQNRWKYEENKHYRTLPLAENVRIENDKVEVLEVFAYSCNHCFNFESNLEVFEKNKASYIDFVRMPVVYSEGYKMHARIYYTAESLGKLDVIHLEVFKAIHLDRKRLMNEKEIYALFEKHGVSKNQFENRFRSFTVESKLNRAERLTKKYKIRSTPTLVINGKFAANGPAIRTLEEMLSVTKELAQREYLARQSP